MTLKDSSFISKTVIFAIISVTITCHQCSDFIKITYLKEYDCEQEDQIGFGKYGSEYLIHLKTDPSKKATFVAFEYNLDLVNDYERGITLQQKINHKNVETIVAKISDRFKPSSFAKKFVVWRMEYFQKGKLSDYLPNNHQRVLDTFTKRLNLFKGIVEGVQAIHKANIIHANLKPESVHVNEHDVPKIFDFSFAQIGPGPDVDKDIGIYTDVRIIGERGKKHPNFVYDLKNDIYALGVLLYVIHNKDYPFNGSGNDLLKNIAKGDYHFGETNPFIVFLIFHMMHSQQAMRPTTEELLEWIDYISELDSKNSGFMSVLSDPFKASNKGEFPKKELSRMGIKAANLPQGLVFLTLEASGLKRKRMLENSGLEIKSSESRII